MSLFRHIVTFLFLRETLSADLSSYGEEIPNHSPRWWVYTPGLGFELANPTCNGSREANHATHFFSKASRRASCRAALFRRRSGAIPGSRPNHCTESFGTNASAAIDSAGPERGACAAAASATTYSSAPRSQEKGRT